MSSSDQSINVPQLIIIIFLGGLAIRYLFFSGGNPAAPNRSSASNIRAREADVEQVQQMFPQVSRRNIMWDLQRNGGNVAATTERILSGRGLEVPPQSFQPPLPMATSSIAPATTAQSKPLQPDLITRYNLKAKLAEEATRRESEPEVPSDGSGASKKQGQAWSQNKVERQTLLQKRREDMILEARRKMEARLAVEKGVEKGT